MSKRTTLILAIAGITAMAGGLAWALRNPASENTLPEELTLASMKEKADKEPVGFMRTIRDAIESDDLTEEQRRELRGNMRKTMRSLMSERIAELAAARTPEDRNEVLNRHIDRFQEVMAEIRAMREQRRKEAEANGESEEEMRERMRERWANAGTEERKSLSESRTADHMMQMLTYMMAVRQRMEERGMEMPQFGPWGRRGRPPGGRPGGGGG
jgi:hypothetical protein